MAKIDEIRTKNLNDLIAKHGGMMKFSALVEKDRTQISQWAKNYPNAQGKPRYISSKMCRHIENCLNLPNEWLDRDHTIGNPVIAVDGTTLPPDTVRIRHVKITVQAGVDGFSVSQLSPEEEESPEYISENTLIKNGWRADSLFNITVRGDSMEPNIYAGDTVKVDTADTTPKDGRVYVINYEGAPVVKRLFRDGDRWIIRSDNPDKTRHPDRTFTDRVFIIGRVVEKRSRRI